MYTIELNFDKTLPAYPKEGQLYRRMYKRKLESNIDVNYMITKSLDSVFKIINPSLCKDSEKELHYLVDLINNESKVEMQILDLDLRGLWITFDKAYKITHPNPNEKLRVHISNIGEYIQACQNNNLFTNESKKINVDLMNICLVFKLLHPIDKNLNGLNTIAMFCDLHFDQQPVLNQNQVVYQLIIKRIELLELNESLGYPKQISIQISNTANPDPQLDIYRDLALVTPIVSFKQKAVGTETNIEDGLREYLNYDEWSRFIFAIRNYYNEKNSKSSKDNQIIYYLGNDQTYGIDDSVSCYLLQLKGKANIGINKNAKYFLINRNDESINYKIHLTNLKTDAANELISELQSSINLLTQNNHKLKNDNKNNDETINTLNVSLKTLNDQLSKQEDNLNIINEQLEAQESKLFTIQSQLADLKNEKSDLQKQRKQLNNDKKLTDKEKNSQLAILEDELVTNENRNKELSLQINSLQPHINELIKGKNIQTTSLEQTKKSINEIKGKISTLNKKIKANMQQIDANIKVINQYDKQIQFVNQDKYTIFAISFRFDDEQNHAFAPIQLVNSALSSDNATANNFYIDEKDSGTLAILNRYADGLEQIRFGYYKNPYLFANLIRPQDLRVEGTKEIDSQILANYQLNANQESAVYKGINIDNFFYLQGPPGTGKTQTICAIANQYALEDKTILMTSQSHEAINNFFDRLDELNSDNPRLIMIKYIADEQKNEANKYNIDYAWKRFVTKCINACDPSNNSNEKYLKIINKLEANNFVMPAVLTKSEINIINNYRKLLKDLPSTQRFSAKYINKIVDNQEFDIVDFPDYINKISSRDLPENNELLNKYDALIADLNKQDKLTKLFSSLSEIKSYLSKDTNNHYASLFRKCYLNEDTKLRNSQIFKKYIVNNHLINIFGITTTSTITLSLLDKTDTDLFYDWPIDIVIIDEISKSTTPEILSRIVLAKKVIFAGDYKQLPPKCDFTKEECLDLATNTNFNVKFNKSDSGKEVTSVYDENSEDKEQEAKKLLNWLSKLYKDSFFNKEVKTLRSLPDRKYAPYQNLVVQHRFCNEIMNVVNTFYEDDEKLQMPINARNFPFYHLKLQLINATTKDYDEPVILIDTSILSDDMVNYYQTNHSIKMTTKDSFDTTKWNKNDYSSAVNPYDCLVICNLVYNLLDSNHQLKLSDIGIITMTKSQKNLIRLSLKKINSSFSKIKVDTVDNFQGREAEVIILDFVRSYGDLKNTTVSLHKRNLEFYFVNERNNVAISRAKAKLIIVGSFKNHYFKNLTISDIASMKKEQDFLQNIYDALKAVIN